MALCPLRVMMDCAKENHFGMAAFNVNNMEQIQAIMEAASELDAPVILQVSRGARKYTSDIFLRHLVLAALEAYPSIPTVIHQDHGNSPETCISAIRQGFSSVMMDGSLLEDGKTVSSYEYNVRVTKEVVRIAHAVGVSVEGELGTIGSIEHMRAGAQEDNHGAVGTLTLDQLLTDPDQAVDFVRSTAIDALAVACGTSHGAYKFTKKPTKDVLVIDRIIEIHEKIPDCHLVMHGSSSVPQELLQQINMYGGKIRPTWGVPVEEIQKALKAGVRKVNVDTDIRLACTGAIREFFVKQPEEFDPRGYLSLARTSIKDLCKARMKAFGQAGMAKKVPYVTLDEMAKRYKEGMYGEFAKPLF